MKPVNPAADFLKCVGDSDSDGDDQAEQNQPNRNARSQKAAVSAGIQHVLVQRPTGKTNDQRGQDGNHETTKEKDASD